MKRLGLFMIMATLMLLATVGINQAAMVGSCAHSIDGNYATQTCGFGGMSPQLSPYTSHYGIADAGNSTVDVEWDCYDVVSQATWYTDDDGAGTSEAWLTVWANGDVVVTAVSVNGGALDYSQGPEFYTCIVTFP